MYTAGILAYLCTALLAAKCRINDTAMKVSSIMKLFRMPILASVAAVLSVVIELALRRASPDQSASTTRLAITGHVDIRVPFSTKPVLELEHSVGSNSFSGVFQITDLLSSSNSGVVLEGVISGPEHLTYKSSASDGSLGTEAQLPGTLWTASVNGTAYSVAVSEKGQIIPSSLKELVYTGPGRVLGLAVDSSGGLYLCNSVQGLVYWRGSGHHMVVANRIAQSSPILPGEPLTYINSVAVAPNGKVYFTSSGHIPPPMHKGVYNTKMSSGYMALEHLHAILKAKENVRKSIQVQGRKSGLLLEFDPATGETKCLATGFWFANGVDISTDGSYAIVGETFHAAVHKHWLTGPKAGTTEDLLSPLPALVDNVLRVPGTTDTFWVGFAVRPSGLLASALCRSKVLRALISYLPDDIRNKAAPAVGGGVMLNGKDGSVERVIVDPTGAAVHSTPSGVPLQTSSGMHLYMGSLENDYIVHAVLR